jgi:hypothetical protein
MTGAAAINSVVSAISGITYNADSINGAVSAVSGIEYNASTINSLVTESISGLSSGVTAILLNGLSGLTVSSPTLNNLSGLTATASVLNYAIYAATSTKKRVYGYYIAGPVSTPFSVAASFLGLTTYSSIQVSPRIVSGITVATVYSVQSQINSGALSITVYAYMKDGTAVTALQELYVDVWGIGEV